MKKGEAPVAALSIYEQLREMIVRGRLPAGARVAEGPLAEWLGVSRTPVREAMQRLRQERLLVSVGGGDVRARLAVAPLDAKQLEELYGLAAALEGLAARAIGKWTSKRRHELAQQLERVERAFHAETKKRELDYDKLFELHDMFHRTFITPAAGPATAALLEAIRPQLDRYEYIYAPLIGPDFSATRVEHAAIIDAIREGSSQDIQRAVRANWLNGTERLGPVIEHATKTALNRPRFTLPK